MATVTVTSSPTTLDTGSATTRLIVDNRGPAPVTLSNGTTVPVFQARQVAITAGTPLTATAPVNTVVNVDGQPAVALDADSSGHKDSSVTYSDLAPNARSGLASSPEMTGTYGPTAVQMLAAFGPSIIPATGVAATDTAAIQAAHDALPAGGGDIRLAAGGTYVVTGGGLTFSKRVRLRGAGAGTRTGASAGAAITIIQCASATANAITVTGAGCSFEDFDLANTSGSTPTAGAGIAITTNGVRTRYRNISVHGFYRNVDVQVGAEWSMTDCLSYDYVKTGLRIANADVPDGGDMGVVNNQFIAGPTNTAAQAGVEWVSGGGLRFLGNKINSQVFGQLTLGLFLHPADGISTSVFTIAGNSIEGSLYGVYSDDTGNSGTGVISKLTITGNEFLTGSGKTIALNRASSGKLSNVVISSNVHTSTIATGGISLTNLADVVLTGNTFGSNITDAGRLSIGSGVTLATLDGFAYTTAARPAASTMRNGSRYWDTTLGKPVWSTGSAWVLADGTAA